jgi:hypothetical protein
MGMFAALLGLWMLYRRQAAMMEHLKEAGWEGSTALVEPLDVRWRFTLPPELAYKPNNASDMMAILGAKGREDFLHWLLLDLFAFMPG